MNETEKCRRKLLKWIINLHIQLTKQKQYTYEKQILNFNKSNN